MKNLLPKFAYGLVGVLVIAAILITLGQRENEANPSANSFNPSGLHALQELLHKNGIETTISRLEQPRLEPNDLVIAAYVEGSGFDVFSSNQLKEIEESLTKHIERGGRVLAVPFDKDFRKRSFEALKATTQVESALSNKTLNVNSSPLTFGYLNSWQGQATSSSASFMTIDYELDTYSPWYKKSGNDPFLTIASKGKGMLARTTDGLFMTNRFIDRNDNAELAIRAIKGLVPEGGKVVFAEAALGSGVSASLISTLGPWASGMWVQLLVLFAVVIFTLGIRFGLPEIERRKQAGQREMIDAIADVYLRAKSTAVALDVAYQSADYRIRRGLKLPAHLSVQERDRLLPPPLVHLLSEVERLKKPHVTVNAKGKQKVTYLVTPKEGLELIRKLECELDAFVPKARNRIS